MSFLKDYRLYTEGNEAHPNYHLWAGLATLSTLVGRRIWVDNGYYRTFPNLYIVLVGPPGNRKTVAKNIALSFLKNFPTINLSGECQSKAGLVLQMADATNVISVGGLPQEMSQMAVYLTELGEFIGMEQNQMIQLLTDLWDQDVYVYKTRNAKAGAGGKDSNELRVVNPYLTMLACTVPDWITMKLRDDVISGGFSRRALFIYETTKGKSVAFPVVSQEARDAFSRVVSRGHAIQKLSGPMKWTPEARTFYEHWYENLPRPTDMNLCGYYETKHDFLQKLTILVAVSEGDDLTMRVPYMELALAILAQAEENMGRVFSGMGRNQLNAISLKLVEFLHMMKGEVSEKKLKAAFWKDADDRELDAIIANLVRSDRALRYQRGDKVVLCLQEFVPPAVLQVLRPAGGTLSDQTPKSGPPPGQSLVQ